MSWRNGRTVAQCARGKGISLAEWRGRRARAGRAHARARLIARPHAWPPRAIGVAVGMTFFLVFGLG